MTDSEFTMFVFLWIFGGIILFQSWRIHRYRTKIEKIAMHGIGAQKALAPAPVTDHAMAGRSEDFEALKKRVQVLERITIEKENLLAREIEDLRATG